MLELTVGNLAYLETVSGLLIPCWIMDIEGLFGLGSSSVRVTIKFTASKGGYKRGETLTTSGLHVVPRGALRKGKYGTTIKPYIFVSPQV